MKSQTEVMAMELLCSVSLLVLQFSAQAAHAHKVSPGPQGLSCVNDFVSTVSCTWDGNPQPLAPGVDCWVIGGKNVWVARNKTRMFITRSCKMRLRRGAAPGCSFVFEKVFHKGEVMPNISMECNGTAVGVITDYKPFYHIKLHPPGLPSINKTASCTWISWSPGSPLSKYLELLEFEAQLTQENHSWQEARSVFTKDQEIKIPSSQTKGSYQVRVRVRYANLNKTHWSSWSPTASWMEAAEEVVPQDPDWLWVKKGLLLSGGLVLLTLIICGSCVINGSFRLLKANPVPSPSKYFSSLHSVHRGNLKKWLNPLPDSDSFFTAEALDQISPVEVCESWHVDPSTSPSSSSTSALLPFQSYPSADSDTSGIVDNFSSSSSSCFYNMGYFMSSSSSSSARTDPSSVYFTYQDDFHHLHTAHERHAPLCPSFTPPAYELLQEPRLPESGFGIKQQDEDMKEGERRVDGGGNEVSDAPQHHSPVSTCPVQPCPPSSALPLPHPPLSQKSCDSHQVDAPVAAAGGSYAAWPVPGMCRSSSMPVEPSKTGYLTLKELQTTFSNKSI